MNHSKNLEIELSKSKLILMLSVSIFFIGLEIISMTRPGVIGNKIFIVGMIMTAIALFPIVFFGFAALYFVKKLRTNSLGLIISNKGVTDNTSSICAGFIPWTDLVEIKETKILNQRFINLVVKNPQDYIDRQNSDFKRKVVQLNHKSFGSVIAISANELKCNYKELKLTIDNRFADFKNKIV